MVAVVGLTLLREGGGGDLFTHLGPFSSTRICSCQDVWSKIKCKAQVNLSRHGRPTKTHKCLGSKMGCWGWWEEGGQSEIGWRNLVLISLRSVGRGLPSANAPPVNMWTDPLLLLLISQHSAARVCRSPILMLWLLRRWCYVRQTTATCCYKLELMLGQYNWLLHSCHSALSKAIWWRPGALPLSVNILHPPRLAAIATLLIEDGLPIIVGCLQGWYSIHVNMKWLNFSILNEDLWESLSAAIHRW